MITLVGKPWPLGATVMESGVNFSVFSPDATKVELLLFDDLDDVNPKVIQLLPEENKSYHYWHVFIPNIGKNQLYGYRVYGDYQLEKGHLFDPSKVLVDPYAKAIVGVYDRTLAHQFGKDNIQSCLKSAVISDEFDWEGDVSPKHDLANSVIYEMHVAGFTKNSNSGVPERLRGTYSGLIEKIDYLKELGVTAVELLPVYAYDNQDAFKGLRNYWGYSPINFFAVHAGYSQYQEPQKIVDEFKTMVKALHKANIEVILDVVYNHTTENDAFKDGPTLCHRGFANNSYYLLDQSGKFKNFTGTGNTVNANHSVVRRMIRHSLKYWVKKMHIDGFRFDLASALSRDESGKPIYNPPILWTIDSQPVLADAKIIAEPWDASGLHQVNNFAGDRWVIWNDGFRDTVRRFVKGDAGQVSELAKRILGSPNEIKARHRAFNPKQNLHFITCHDGFTLNDLVSYNQKHNHNNGESNNDGHNQNHSWNCGEEGETNILEVEMLRNKQVKNFLAILFLSNGTPMISMGDEIRRTQRGNNNAYCQNNSLSWMNWDLMQKHKDIFQFTKKLIAFTNQHKTFSHEGYFQDAINNYHPFVKFHGIQLGNPDWGFNSHSIAIQVDSPIYQEQFYVIMNMYFQPLTFDLPHGKWEQIFNTEDGFKTNHNHRQINCPSRTIICLKRI